VFGLCASLWEALYGAPPFPTRAADLVKALLPRAPDPVAPPQTDVPRWLKRVCLRGLARPRWQRYDGMPELLAALESGRSRTPRHLLAGLLQWLVS